MILQTYQIDLVPHGEPVVVHVSQYDTGGRSLAFELYNGGVAYSVPAGVTASITGTKPDGTGFMYPMTVSGNVVTIDLEQQMALLAGDVPAEITLTSADGKVSTANFIIRVERAALDEDTAISETDIPIFETLVDRAETAAADAETAATEAGNAADAAEDAQAATEALFPAGGSAGQFLQKTAGGTTWATATGLPDGGSAGQVLTKLSATDGDADWETPDYLPTGGSVGQFLQKTASGAAWASVTAAGSDLAVTFTQNGSAYTADHTWAEIVDCISNGGTPYGIYNNVVYTLGAYTAGASVSFIRVNNNGAYYIFRITSADAVTFSANPAYLAWTATLSAASWVGNVYTYSSGSIPAESSGTVTLTLPNMTTEADLEAAIAAFEGYDLYAFNQRSGAIDIYARGTVPTADITIAIIVTMRY